MLLTKAYTAQTHYQIINEKLRKGLFKEIRFYTTAMFNLLQNHGKKYEYLDHDEPLYRGVEMDISDQFIKH